jgi:hypothetical protein
MQSGRRNVQVEPLASEDVERMAVLAREIWYDHYPKIITTAQIEYMLEQRYAAPVGATSGGTSWWWTQSSAASPRSS